MDALKYLVHFYHSDEHLFQTITMLEDAERGTTLDALVEKRSWYWGRFSATERAGYMERRLAVEEMLYAEFSDMYWPLKRRRPAYLYLMPNVTAEQVDQELGKRRTAGERDTKWLLFELDSFGSRSDMTFTLDDSMRSYRSKLLARGIACRELDVGFSERKDHGRIFHIDELARVYERNIAIPALRFEVQVWDRDVLTEYMTRQGSARP